jgi:hypothetical protein
LFQLQHFGSDVLVPEVAGELEIGEEVLEGEARRTEINDTSNIGNESAVKASDADAVTAELTSFHQVSFIVVDLAF